VQALDPAAADRAELVAVRQGGRRDTGEAGQLLLVGHQREDGLDPVLQRRRRVEVDRCAGGCAEACRLVREGRRRQQRRRRGGARTRGERAQNGAPADPAVRLVGLHGVSSPSTEYKVAAAAPSGRVLARAASIGNRPGGMTGISGSTSPGGGT
jgi:hypothetical protein